MPTPNELDLLVETLERVRKKSRPGDAIDAALQSEPRRSAAFSLREHDVVRTFREEMRDGLIRLDTANQLLGLLRRFLEVAEKP